jgi:hypothetical protein
MTEVLYFDKQITLYRDLIVINKYYFPLATSRTIMFSEIERVALVSSEGVTQRWGTCGKYLNNWFPLDNERKKKDKFIEIVLKGKKIRPSITPDDTDKVFRIIWENFTPEGKRYVEEASERAGKETEIAQQELIDREKDFENTKQQLKPKREVARVEKVEIDDD